MFCRQCGTSVGPQDTFCASCGTPLKQGENPVSSWRPDLKTKLLYGVSGVAVTLIALGIWASWRQGVLPVGPSPSSLDSSAANNLARTQTAANEAGAVGSLRALNTACVVYSGTYGRYPLSLAVLGPPAGATVSAAAADLIDAGLASGTKNGYRFTYRLYSKSGNTPFGYSISADPVAPGKSGTRWFFTDQSGIIRESRCPIAEVH